MLSDETTWARGRVEQLEGHGGQKQTGGRGAGSGTRQSGERGEGQASNTGYATPGPALPGGRASHRDRRERAGSPKGPRGVMGWVVGGEVWGRELQALQESLK